MHSVHSGLETPDDDLIWSENVNVGSPSSQSISVDAGTKSLSADFVQFFRAKVRLPEALTASEEEFCTSTANFIHVALLFVSNAVVGSDHRFVFILADLVKSRDKR